MDKVINSDISDLSISSVASRQTWRFDIKNNGADVKHNFLIHIRTVEGLLKQLKGPVKLELKEGVELNLSVYKIAIAEAQVSWEDDCGRIRRRTENIISNKPTGFQYLSCVWWGSNNDEEIMFISS